MHPDVETVLFSAERIGERVSELGAEIASGTTSGDLLLVGVLKGAVVFAADLMRSLPVAVELDFIAVGSYGRSAQSSGEVRLLKDLEASIEGRDVLLVEDIVDSGRTLQYLAENLRRRGPRSLRICALLDKPSRREVPITADYVGFAIPDHFVVGYGLDYAQRYRQLPYIGVLKKEVYGG